MSFNGRSGSDSDNGRETDPFPENEQAPGEEPLTPYQINALELEGQGGYALHNSNENEPYPEIEQARFRGRLPGEQPLTPDQIAELELDSELVNPFLPINPLDPFLGFQEEEEPMNEVVEVEGVEGVDEVDELEETDEEEGFFACEVCQDPTPPLIRACHPDCVHGHFHYDCLVNYLILMHDPLCEHCGEHFFDPEGRMDRYYDTPDPTFLRVRFMRDAFLRWRTMNLQLTSTLLFNLFIFAVVLPYFLYTGQRSWFNTILALNMANVTYFMLLLWGNYHAYEDLFPHKYLRFRELEGHPDGVLVVDITEAQRRATEPPEQPVQHVQQHEHQD